jgi:hypothetical protein
MMLMHVRPLSECAVIYVRVSQYAVRFSEGAPRRVHEDAKMRLCLTRAAA